nr:MAG TPA: hypothetical protein [Caudoviricetes sp.]
MILSQIDKAVYNDEERNYVIASTYFKNRKEITKEEYKELSFSLVRSTMYDKIETYYLDDGWETRYTKIMED